MAHRVLAQPFVTLEVTSTSVPLFVWMYCLGLKTMCCCCCAACFLLFSERAEDIYRIVALQLGVPLIEVRQLHDTSTGSSCSSARNTHSSSSSSKLDCTRSSVTSQATAAGWLAVA
jgi:hypothetical protein